MNNENAQATNKKPNLPSPLSGPRAPSLCPDCWHQSHARPCKAEVSPPAAMGPNAIVLCECKTLRRMK
jgi:hypothetical protein